MDEKNIRSVAEELNIGIAQVRAAWRLLTEGATVPFIARYRKEATGSLTEELIIAVRDRMEEMARLEKRCEAVIKSLTDQGLLTDDLRERILSAETLAKLEDLYLPYRPKRRTRATVAREKGLEPLARILFGQGDTDPFREAEAYLSADRGVATIEQALSGARDIMAEWINEDSGIRQVLRTFFATKAVLRSRVAAGMEEKGVLYRDYYDWEELASSAPSHRILAIRRGAAEGILTIRTQPDEEEALSLAAPKMLSAEPTPRSSSEQVYLALKDGYRRLLCPSLETELRLELKKRADREAIKVFTENIRNLLLSPPLGGKALLAVDPGFRTGCKAVCLDRQGKFLAAETIYPLEPHRRIDEAVRVVKALAKRFGAEAVAVGNGTGGREAEEFLRAVPWEPFIPVIMVSESGASVYSASAVAREEFPDQDVTIRGAVSIGRRLMDPLAELVKIDPKSIGVGQYQHDVDQSLLKEALDDTVVSAVNAVGVEVNTASKELLRYVSGLSDRLAGALVTLRNERGPFKSRGELANVPGLGPRTFEQAAGFLRVRHALHPLDSSAVHPERYVIVEAMARDAGVTLDELMKRPDLRSRIELSRYVAGDVGMPTLTDIMEELAKPGRDPRDTFEPFNFAAGINDIDDLDVGMTLPGLVTNVAAFGAFVDIGLHDNGLVHISELSDRFVKDPHEAVKVHQRVTVTVIAIDRERKRISLSMKSRPFDREKPREKRAPERERKEAKRQNNASRPDTKLSQALKGWQKS
ncbi:MAG: RNA-binding transcriptional accessory protein [Deltaproteobacteria bacterium]|nr:RNA-binding transcriptional accessory protein [Deltaproteobacteria bacterium]